MATYQECRVYYRDFGSVEHAVYVHAVNRFHAFGRAMVRLRKCSWSNPDCTDVRKMTVQLLSGRWPKVVVTREQFEEWINKKDREHEQERQDIKMYLGRIPPDRDFQARVMRR